jgi:hypothetical protein
MSKYTISKREVIYRVYEVDADSEENAINKVKNNEADIKEAINKVKNNEADIKELASHRSYNCDLEWAALSLGWRGHEEEYNRYKASRNSRVGFW